jgi:hypothetical protein
MVNVFFYNETHARYACFELDWMGKVWFRDGCTDRLIYTHCEGHWVGFSNGGTLRGLVEMMRD